MLETNEKISISKSTKHIKVRFFFIKYAIAHGDLSMYYCPTKKIRADILTKPLQGTEFKEMRAMIMNCPVEYVDLCTKDVKNISGVYKTD